MKVNSVETSSSRVSGLPQGNVQMYLNINLGIGRVSLDCRSRFCHQEVPAEDMKGWRERAKGGEGQELGEHSGGMARKPSPHRAVERPGETQTVKSRCQGKSGSGRTRCQ